MSGKKNIHEGHRQRLKRKLLNSDDEEILPHEALEALLFYALPQKNTNEIAHELIQRFGGISRVFEANMSDLMQVDGVKEHTATLLKLQTVIYKMYLKDKYEVKNEKLTPYSAGQFAIKLFYGYTVEVLFAIMLDAEFRLISWKKLATGTTNSTPVYTREVLAYAIETKAANVILAHNHPNGMLIPSAGDIKVTTEVERALAFANVALIDHIIVADNKYTSVVNEMGHINYVAE